MILELKKLNKSPRLPNAISGTRILSCMTIWFSVNRPIPKEDEQTLTHFRRYYEIIMTVGMSGYKIFYANEEDIFKKRAQILMVIGEENNGIGTKAINLLLQKVRGIIRVFIVRLLRS